ncbi:prepilin-type N-terminal cleavage/methylation domain-containing protein [Vibrio sp. SS-MA-C1-2]|uniref:prepilin-type N-terminal cleavage/methylation domain-containing protein n=1 Tax=Vibrio sp. SS-MA-C1-2 TaxID=2908646 RepID=UPI001F3FF5CC|nr:prepilin-type N-terminal cleavage/methylation domain-containing protein [Vibrio sp. SS-MA-C1-2]UJF18995.1 prepilin-type N-terminal cleavage/methylation domain-containing protein [Vibrio sp. SS-MA-C1-2]
MTSKNQHGFTLYELLLTTVLLSLFIGMFFTTLQSQSKFNSKLMMRLNMQAEIVTLLALMKHDMTQTGFKLQYNDQPTIINSHCILFSYRQQQQLIKGGIDGMRKTKH